MIKVCDAIMGSGKSSAAITYMNERPNEKFIYITPYLDEAARIKNECPELNFVEPSDKLSEYKWKKCLHTEALIESGRNIATTHQAFERYKPSLLENIKQQKYTLIIDETISPFCSLEFSPKDIDNAVELGYVENNDGVYSLTSKQYDGNVFRSLINTLKTRDIIEMVECGNKKLFIFGLPSELITSFKDVILLTYMFDGQSFKYFFDINNIKYEHIGVKKDDDAYRFCDSSEEMPKYVYDLGNKIHILDHEKLNNIGKNKTALSMNWFKTASKDRVKQLKDNIFNCYNNIWNGIPIKQRLWSTYSEARPKISGRGYIRRFLSFNARATNEYRQCDHLVYAVNIYMNVSEKLFYQKRGIKVDEDAYALSTMIQWIWRSAIRDGKDIYIYIPSQRMRNLLINWINEVSKSEVVK